MDDILAWAEADQAQARAVLHKTGVVAAWEGVGATVNLVGSLRTGLLLGHLDIDLHIYSHPLRIGDSFAAMARIAAAPGVLRMQFANLLHAEDHCLEWHAWVRDEAGREWQLDMIHMAKGSPWDGYFERVAERIAALLTPETRRAILDIKAAVPPGEKVMGIEIYQAVLRDGVRGWAHFARWREANPARGIVDWMP
ncbi:hypothetical protein [Desulfocurvus vexinensis]|uniref:hypothetical protein n=1 Tax=Desulfocurvus vexinensis TaxID=399548 RepID=UPI0004916B34|nr:hypothetical protein [Desulfocurvus vexinensis]